MINPTIHEWLNFIARWVHVFAGIMWVGTTYYFTWLDARLTEEEKALANTGVPEAGVWKPDSTTSVDEFEPPNPVDPKPS